MKVAVLAGGRSSEHDVSLASAESVREGLVESGHEPLDIRIDRAGHWTHEGRPVALEPSGGFLARPWRFPCCMARSARTARCRACSSCSTFRTWAPA